ncbi:MAG: rod shape-determining protein RodA [Gammaproteobacteria bacterium]|nr:rod shape-determining protein RodA [Gammaproteobacteria bacterium]
MLKPSSKPTVPLFFKIANLLRLDYPLAIVLVLLFGWGTVVLYSASGENFNAVIRHLIHFGIAFFAMIVFANIPPTLLQKWSPYFFAVGLLGLFTVLLIGDTGKGAQRWLDLGFIRFQPSEIMKIAVPMAVAWSINRHPLPPTFFQIIATAGLIIAPAFLVAQQPDLGTALLVASSGFFVIFLAGIRFRYLFSLLLLALIALPLLWYNMHTYQKQRVLTFLNPESDPLGSGYHIIQSTISIGSGGIYGKGWLNGSQSQLQFLPERTTDFIFAVMGEEFGLLGACSLLLLYSFIIFRSLYITADAQETYARLLAGSLSLTFFIYVFVNIGMVTGLLPVVGVPLPLVSYGGTSMVTLMVSFGMIMSAQAHRRLLSG